jgi:hypothetical protein
MAVERARRHVFDHHVRLADQLLHDRLAFGRLGMSISSDRLLLLSMVKYSASAPGMSRSWMAGDVVAGGMRSTFRTSAPNHAIIWQHAVPTARRCSR